MKKNNGNKKGGSYERKIAKKFSLWLSGGKRDDLFWRTHGSGARDKVRMDKGLITEGQDGDMASTSQSYESISFRSLFTIEIKFYRDVNIWGLLTLSNRGLIEFWNEVEYQAEYSHKHPILIIKENYRPDLLISDGFFEKNIRDYFNIDYRIKSKVNNTIIYIWKLSDIFELDYLQFHYMIDKLLKERN